MSCDECRILKEKLERIRAILDDEVGSTARGRQVKILTEAGRVIAAQASARGVKLTDLSRRAGFAPDYVGKLCRGELALSRRAAMLLGTVLGIDLLPLVDGPKPEPQAEPLPFTGSAGVVAS